MRWEDICTNCGLCCHEKLVLPDMLVIDPDKKCEFYSEENKRCTVYNERFEKCSRCRKVTPFMAMVSPSLPSVCGYVQYMRHLHLRLVQDRELILSEID